MGRVRSFGARQLELLRAAVERGTYDGTKAAIESSEQEDLQEQETPADGAVPSQRDALATTAVQLALSFPIWVRRRKWSITYVDDTTVRQQQSVCFRLPDERALPVAGRLKTLLVPLWISKKVPLTNVDARDEEGRALSIMSKQENGEIAARGLFWILKGLMLAKPDGPGTAAVNDDDLLYALRTITTATDAAAAEVKTARATIAELGVVSDRDERAALIEDLVEGFLLLVPVANEPGRDRVLKVAFETPHLWHGEQASWKERRESFLASLGLTDKPQSFPEIQIGWSLSTHVQVSAPPEVELGEAWLDVNVYDAGSDTMKPTERYHVVYDRPTAEVNVSVSANWDFADPPQPKDENDPEDPAVLAHGQLMSRRGDTAELHVRLGPTTRGPLLAAAVVSTLTAILLWLAFVRLAELDGQTSAALLLALPVISTAFLARPGEHAFAARLLVGVRVAALMAGVCALVVAGLIAAGGTREKADPAPASFKDITCEASNRFSGSPGQRVRQLRELTCSGTVAQARPEDPNATSIAWRTALGSALTASLLAVLLLSGFARTFLADLRRRNRADTFAGVTR